jgi:flagellar hook-associated protein 1 FlgK
VPDLDVHGLDVRRLRDDFLEARGLQERATDAGLRRTSSILGGVESALPEPGDDGIQAALADLWSAWDDVANQPEDAAARARLVRRARTLAGAVSATAATLAALRSDALDQLTRGVDQVNEDAAQVAELNRAVRHATAAGRSTGDLTDRRDLLVGRLARSAGVTVRTGADGVAEVFLGGGSLVQGARAGTLAVGRAAAAEAVTWKDAGHPATVVGGELGATLAALNATLPGWAGGLDRVAAALEEPVNHLHRQGLDQDGNPGQPFFQHDAAGTAATLRVNPAIAADPRLVAARDPAKGPVDGSVAARLAELGGGAGGPEVAYRAFVVGVGVAVDAASRRADLQGSVTRQLDAAREAEPGGDLDQEMTAMLAYRHGYEAAARLLTRVDSALARLVQSTGPAGR